VFPILTADADHRLEVTAYNRDERFVAHFYGVDAETVRGWRKRGQGPRYKKINGKLIRYSLADLTAWAESQPGPGERTPCTTRLDAIVTDPLPLTSQTAALQRTSLPGIDYSVEVGATEQHER